MLLPAYSQWRIHMHKYNLIGDAYQKAPKNSLARGLLRRLGDWSDRFVTSLGRTEMELAEALKEIYRQNPSARIDAQSGRKY